MFFCVIIRMAKINSFVQDIKYISKSYTVRICARLLRELLKPIAHIHLLSYQLQMFHGGA